MYNQRRSRAPIIFIILAGIITGIGFLIITSLTGSSQDESALASDDLETISEPSSFSQSDQPDQGQTDSNPPQDIDTAANSSEITAEAVAFDNNDLGGAATIFIPSASIYAPIVRVYLDGTSWDVSRLGANIGHLEGTSWIGDGGNIVLSGHVELSDGRRGIFANLSEVNIGDFAILEHNGVEYRYVVINKYTTAPTDLSPIYPTETDRLTLITCDNYDFFQDSYLDRTIIVAERLS